MRDLTTSQQLIWAGQRLQPDDPLYNMILAFRIRGALDPARFQEAFAALVAGCDSLRTIIMDAGERPQQVALDRLDTRCEFVDLTGHADAERAWRQWSEQRRTAHLNLAERHFDTVLLKLGEREFVWWLNQHHILTDASSVAVLFSKLEGLYRLACAGRLAEAEALPPFGDYLAYEAAQRATPAHEKARAFWRQRPAGQVDSLRFYGVTPAHRSGRTARVPLSLGRKWSERLRAMTADPEYRAFTMDLALFQLFATTLFAFLYRVTGQTRLAIGMPSHNRASAKFRNTAGLLIELFPLQVNVEPKDTFAMLHRRVAHATQAVMLNARPGASDAAQLRAFEVVLNFINARFGDFDGVRVESEWIHSGYGDRNHVLRLQVHDFDGIGEIGLYFDLNEDAFPAQERARVPAQWLALLDAFCDDPGASVVDVDLLDSRDRTQVIAGFRDDRGAPAPDETVIEMFERCVSARPEATAVNDQGAEYSFRDLAAASDRLARVLASRGVLPGAIVGLFAERSAEAVIAILAVLKCGAAYVPLDLEYPPERVGFMLSDAKARAVLVGRDLAPKLPSTAAEVIEIGEAAKAAASVAAEPAAFTSKSRAEALAYVIYTSGSTGKPKGVAVTHRNLANYVAWAARTYVGNRQFAFPLFTTLAFDLTVTSIFVPLITGGRIVVYRGGDESDGLLVRRVMEDDRVDVVKLTPAHVGLLQGMNLAGSRIKAMIVGGEDFKADLARTIFRRFGGAVDIYNEYGPTEATVGCMIHRFDAEADRGASVPIGRAIDNADVYLLDEARRLVPLGVTGEIYIGGVGVANGYLNRLELTAQRFVDNPFRQGEKMYASGDLGAWSAAGVMSYLGRADDQVKIRGVRVETAEVEAALLAHPGVRGCVVAPTARGSAARLAGDAGCCVRCGLSGNHPDAWIDSAGVCRICRIYAEERAQAQGYMRSMADLERIVAQIRSPIPGQQDCIMLLSGGKDSTYALCRLVDLGLTPLVFTLDNGFISDGAKANIRRVVDRLGLELVTGSTPAMNEIFVDSLNRFSNVCNGCFKTIYTLSMKLAHERGLRTIFTGLSRGQIFETRVAGLFQQRVFDSELIDRTVIAARKAYHRMDDAVSRLLDIRLFERDEIFEEITFIDFYRYCDVTLDEILGYLAGHVPWIRPADTGRSTNCLINAAGIFVHKRERGFHNYALPYSWDVRLGHKQRDAALAELDDAIDESSVRRILAQIGYTEDEPHGVAADQRTLAAWYVAGDEVSSADLKAWLRRYLPDAFIPAHFVRMDALPVTANGKIDRRALPPPDALRPAIASDYAAPRNSTEEQIARIWAEILGAERVGVNDDFFELGGDSILNIQIVARAKKMGIGITPEQIFRFPTVSGLAKVATSDLLIDAEQGPVVGEMALTPMQRQYFENLPPQPHHFCQLVWLETTAPIQLPALCAAARAVVEHHDALRSRFVAADGEWRQFIEPSGAQDVRVDDIDVSSLPVAVQSGAIDARAMELQRQLDLRAGGLFRIARFRRGASHSDLLLLYAHHLIIDVVSWWPLLEDLETAYLKAVRNETVTMPLKTTSVRRWGEQLARYARADKTRAGADYWLSTRHVSGEIPVDFPNGGENLRAVARTHTTALDAAQTARLLQDVPAVYAVRVPEVILTAILTSLGAWSRCRDLRIDVEGHGREVIGEGIDMLRTAGWFTSVFPFVARFSGTSDLAAALREVKERFRALPNRGLDFGALRYLGAVEDENSLATLPKAAVLFSYLGQWDQALATSTLFQFARPIEISADPGATRSHLLAVSALVHRGRLRIDWTYSGRHYREETIRRLAAHALDTLACLVEHCIKSRGGGLTTADFPAAEISQSELENLLAEFGAGSSSGGGQRAR